MGGERDPSGLSPPQPPPAQSSPKPRSVKKIGPSSSTPSRQIFKPILPKHQPKPPTSGTPPPATPSAQPSPRKSLLVEKKERKEAREAEKQMVNSLFRSLIESYEVANQLKSKEIELLEEEKNMREKENNTVEPAVSDEDELFLKSLLPYMKKLSDARRLKLRNDYQLLLMEAFQDDRDGLPSKRSKKH